jgi:hypothetical protein
MALKEALTEVIKKDEQLFAIVANILCPQITKYIAQYKNYTDDFDFYGKFVNKLKDLSDLLKNGTYKESEPYLEDEPDVFSIPVDTDYLNLLRLSENDFKVSLPKFNNPEYTLLPTALCLMLDTTRSSLEVYNVKNDALKNIDKQSLYTMSSIDIKDAVASFINETEGTVMLLLALNNIVMLEQQSSIDTSYEAAFKTLKLEEQLLADIRAMDPTGEFYYNVPAVASLAIELNESTKSHNTLMNPKVNYDINNVNNSFVISKLDINFLDSGIKLARSSRLN